MTGIQIWQLLTDVGLIGSVVYLAIRYIKAPSSNETIVKLEESAEQLIKDAEASTRNLNSELMKRQQNLEQLLGQFESIEKRIKRSIGEATKGPSIATPISPQSKAPVVTSGMPEDSGDRPIISRKSVRSDSLREEVKQPERQTRNRVNIYGEPISDETLEVFESASPITPVNPKELAKMLERRISGKKETKQDSIELDKPVRSGNMYKLAEELIIAGEDIKNIAAQTRMSAADIRMLKEMIESRKESEIPIVEVPDTDLEVKRSDPRLGVLANISV